MSSSFEQEQSEVGVQFKISSDANAVITRSAKEAIRSKKAEAKLRLEDHCKRFPDWKP
ncbi:TraY domain-containing protein [Vibrio sagamiensis]|uniref:Relaxosome protein TraY n=1 Tax=Vibrio sagamiensis NBRC 104589 TaxID=1219064 RepID=A0A511QJ54_9VIBR|nr:TraY domain-containing protein [Vibrio sagamiensis]PNQ71034.1 TraY domain-containing protein [Vibrio agarivorans]PNQ71121.1 TraY domain-containing protein [Vibrio agarivorans]GEM77217.1 hypothetical protein VSA01S_33290 [Vibrio sagamiensis NBRC 104589]